MKWKIIPTFSNYEISELGELRRKLKYKTKNGRIYRYYKNNTDNKGYIVNMLTNDAGEYKLVGRHILIALTFKGYKRGVKGLVIDHIDNNKLNNKASNIQIITSRTNSSKDRKNTISGLTGVFIVKQTGKWQARITVNGKRENLGTFDDKYEASKVYQKRKNEVEKEKGLTVQTTNQ